jgi:hypothetical protein
VIFSKDLTAASSATVLKTIIVNINGLDNTNNQFYTYSLIKVDNHEYYHLTLGNFTE